MVKEYQFKNTSSRWFDEIPKDWHLSKLKFLVNIFTGNSLNDAEKELFFSDEDIFIEGNTYVSSKDINVNTNICNYETGMTIPYSETKYKVAPKNSTLLCIEGGSAGRKITFTKEDVCFVNKLACFESEESTNSKFIFYYLQSNEFKSQFENSLSGLIGGVSLTNLKDLEIAVPAIDEQSKIAQFLDQKTEQIDSIIEKKQNLLLLLEEKKKAVINEAVTKGLNPNVPMKDSGIEWIGEIPTDWKVSTLKYICEFILDGTHGSHIRVDEGYRLLSVRNIIDNKFVFRNDDSFIGKLDYDLITSRFKIREKDIILAIVGATLGKSAFVEKMEEEFATQRSVATIRVKEEFNQKYFHYFIASDYYYHFLWSNTSFSAQPGVYLNTLSNSNCIIPNKIEQDKIVQFIEKNVSEINNLNFKISSQIEKLKEYRQSIISEAVTGKIDVSNYN